MMISGRHRTYQVFPVGDIRNTSEGDVEAMREYPALRLLEFFRSRATAVEGREPLGLVRLSADKAEDVSETLHGMLPLGEDDAKRWVAAWKASGFLKK